MSSSRTLRSAFEACRPSTTSRLQLRFSTQRRTFAEKRPADTTSKSQATPAPKSQVAAGNLPAKDPSARTTPAVSGATPKVPRPSQSTSASTQSKAASSTSTKTSPSPQSTELSTTSPSTPTPEQTETPLRPIPANVLAAYRTPLKHQPPHGVPVASLQLRSYSVRSLEFFSDFALRAAYYLNLPASGPVPLPKKIERWTTIRSNFVHKKSQENFERITHKRLITIMDGHHSAVEVWLAVLRKWQFYGVGMKANVWEWEGLDVSKKMDAQARDLESEVNAKLALFGFNKSVAKDRSVVNLLQEQGTKQAGVGMADVREMTRYHNPDGFVRRKEADDA